ncbi:MAG TPA: ADOP family duplicated permease [Terracidiphilus sp.]|jgi:predicted permease
MRWWQIRNRDAELQRELQADLELEEEEQRESGLTAEDARYAARRAFGNATLIREQTHEAWGWAPLEHLWQDVRYALRQLNYNKRFTAVCVMTLALGIGAQSAIYSVIYAVLIDPYPYRGAMRMVHLHLYDKDPAPDDLSLDGPQFAAFEKSPVLDGALADDRYTMALTGEELPEQLNVSRMSANSSAFFGVPALLGREFNSSDRNRVAVLSYHFWKSHYAQRTDTIGKFLQLNRENYTIVGVLPQRFAWMGADVYVPLPYSTDSGRIASVYARIREGVSDRAAEQALQPLLDTFAKETPANFPRSFKVHLVHMNEVEVGQFRGVLIFLFISVSFLLALACVNVAILLLARGEARQAEIAMRKALGAGTHRILAQLLTESLLLSAAGGAFGVALAVAGVRAAMHFISSLPSFFPGEAEVAVNLPVLAFSVCASMLTGILGGLWPALRASHTELAQATNRSAHKLAGRQGTRSAQMVLLTVQVAMTILLLVCSGATLRKLHEMIHADLGYDPQNLASVFMVLREAAHNQWADRVHYFEQVRAVIAADPDVLSATVGILPPSGADPLPVSLPGQKDASDSAIALGVSKDYFATVRIPLIAGRIWTQDETLRAAHFALINEAMRRRYWPNANPLGATIVLNNGIVNGNAWKLVAPGNNQHFQIIGVVGDSPNRGLDEQIAPGVYVPYSMTPFDGFTVTFRSRGNPGILLHSIKKHVHDLEPDQAVGEFLTANDLLEGDSLARKRFVATLFAAFASLALIFAASGLYSTLSYFVAQRRQELGVRIALGARRMHIIDTVIRPSVLSILIGSGAGVAINIALSATLDRWTSGDARDPAMLLAVIGVLLAVSAAASLAPAVAATSIDPARALRSE